MRSGRVKLKYESKVALYHIYNNLWSKQNMNAAEMKPKWAHSADDDQSKEGLFRF